MEEKRRNGQCYFCPEPYSKEHKCAAKGGVFLMDLADSEEDPLSEINNLEISLHALTGLNSVDSMMMQVTVGRVQLWVWWTPAPPIRSSTQRLRSA